MKKLGRWFRIPKSKKRELEARIFEETATKEAEKRLKEMLDSENPEILAAVEGLKNAGII